ncbi:MAG: alpha/beta hydrolase [Anaerolineales bacterium]
MATSEWRWSGQDGTQFYARQWTPEKPQAAVILIHGHGEHINRYAHVAQAFNQAGFALLGFDLRGHGQSEGQRGHTPSYEQMQNDIADFFAQVMRRYPGLPLFFYGHSMGGNLTLNYLLRAQPAVRGAIVTGPWIRLAFEPPAAKIALAKMMDAISPSFSQSSGLETAALSRNKAVVEAYIADPLVHSKITSRLFLGMYAAGLWSLEHAAELKVPLLLMHGSADRLTSPAASREFAEKAGSLVTFKLWDGFYHEIHNEPEQAEVIQTMVAWLTARMAG